MKKAEESENLKNILRLFPLGALLKDIETHPNAHLPRRTLQRRLLTLQQSGQIRIEGKARATKYFLVAKESIPSLSTQSRQDMHRNKNEGFDISQFSIEAKHLLAQITRPLHQRTPVSYNRQFLDTYKPNVTHYLSEEEKEELARIGKTSTFNQPAGTYTKEILARLLIDLSWNSSRLEGNTYSLLDTQRLISFGEIADDKSAIEAQMILNHKDAIEFLVYSVDDIDFNAYTLLNLHALLSNDLLPDSSASGRLRTLGVGIYQSVYEPLSVPQLISESFHLVLEKARHIQDPFEQAFFIMVHIPYLQPFDDVNKRVSRLAVNIPLNRHNLIPLAFVDVPHDLYIQGTLAIYEMNRVELLKEVFIWAYKRSVVRYAAIRQSIGEPDPFRLKYREIIRSIIRNIIIQEMTPKTASKAIQQAAQELPTSDQSKFIEVVDTEFLSLHEGNFARYRIRPSEFIAWKTLWSRKNNP